MFSLNDKRAMNQGFGDGMSRAFELVMTPLLFGVIGLLIDQVAGTAPVFVVVLGVFGVVGTFVRMWYGYEAEMRSHESAARWASRPGTVGERDEPVQDLWSARRPGADS